MKKGQSKRTQYKLLKPSKKDSKEQYEITILKNFVVSLQYMNIIMILKTIPMMVLSFQAKNTVDIVITSLM